MVLVFFKNYRLKNMLYGRRAPEAKTSRTGHSKKILLDPHAQWKYLLYHTVFVVLSAVLLFLPSFYFIHQNYSIFTKIAYDTHPGLIIHLERETTWLSFFLIISLILIGFVSFILSWRMVRHLTNPLYRMERHMRKLLQGHWHIPDFEYKQSDFKDLALTYDYFYRVLKINTEMELRLLERLNIDSNNREAYAAWKSLMEIKQKRLGLATSNTGFSGEDETKVLNALNSVESAATRRVS